MILPSFYACCPGRFGTKGCSGSNCRSLGRRLIPSAIFVFALCGCTIRYCDTKNETVHVWGFGHLKMRAVPLKGDHPPYTNAAIAFVTGVRTLGFTVGAGDDYRGFSAGWDSRSRLVITSEDAQFSLIWPTNSLRLPNDLKDLFTVYVKTNFPWITNTKPKECP